MRKAGIYKITNQVDGKAYIGSSVELVLRVAPTPRAYSGGT